MKVTIDIDLTPSEFREAVGLPDVKAVQDRWIEQIERTMADEIEKLSPEAIVQQWTNALMPNTELFSSLMKAMPGLAEKK